MEKDPRGYYARLGLSTSATASEIKSAYRNLAKLHHPDVVGGDSGFFHACTEAYETLGDPIKRAAYDTEALHAPIESSAPLDLVVCSQCNQVTAQPRRTVFRYVFSLLLTTITTPVQGIFCAKCARKAALRSSVLSGLFGWWGIPWGPIQTVREIIRNANGGERMPNLDDRLTLYGAYAFASRGNLRLAHAIACQLLRSSSPDSSRESARLVAELERMGVPKDNPQLKDSWRMPLGYWVAHATALAVVPLAIWIAFAVTASPQPASPGYAPNSSSPLSALPLEGSPSSAASQPVICSRQLENGHIFDRMPQSDDGHRLTIKNGSAGNAIVKVRDALTGRTVASFWVAQNSTASLSDIPSGTYRFMYATGDQLGASCDAFNAPTSLSEFPRAETFVVEETPTHLISKVLEYTLYDVVGGNVRPRAVDPAAFNAP